MSISFLFLGKVHSIMLNSAILEIQITVIKIFQNVRMVQHAIAKINSTGSTSNTLQDHTGQEDHRTVSHTLYAQIPV
jgi:hypothetical protein